MAIVVVIINGRGLTIDTHHRHYSNKSCLALYKVLIHCNSHYKQPYSSNKMERFGYKGGCGVCERTRIKTFKEELAWVIDKQLRVISNKNLFKAVLPLRN